MASLKFSKFVTTPSPVGSLHKKPNARMKRAFDASLRALRLRRKRTLLHELSDSCPVNADLRPSNRKDPFFRTSRRSTTSISSMR